MSGIHAACRIGAAGQRSHVLNRLHSSAPGRRHGGALQPQFSIIRSHPDNPMLHKGVERMHTKYLRAAFATDDQQTVNAEFANAKHLMIYEVTQDGSSHQTTHDFPGGESGGMESPRILALKDCALVFVSQPVMGDDALALMRSHIFVTKLQGQEQIADLLIKLQTTLRDNPPPWMRKAWKVDHEGEVVPLQR